MWYVYILECKNKTYYTGVTNNVEKRLADHNAGKGAKYTRAHLPVKLAFKETPKTKRDAMKREYEIKTWPRSQKEFLIKSNG